MADETAKKQKTPKKQGPIRWEAIVPFTIFVALVWLYFALFFDGHLRRGLELGGTLLNGAEVNVGGLKTSFFRASLDISDIQVTDVDQPTTNKLQIGTVRWHVLWDALLRGKIAIADASILDIGVGTLRKRPGRVLPKPPPNTESATDKLREQALEQAQKQFGGNVLGDVAAMLDGVDPKEQLRNIETSLVSSTRLKELDQELKNKEKEWKERIGRLPHGDEIKAYNERLKSIKLDGFKDPGEVQASVKQVDALIKEIDGKVKEIEATAKAIDADTNKYKSTFDDLEKSIKKDIEDIEARLKIPKLDVKNLAASLFAPTFMTKLRQAQFYMAKARTYMPPKKSAEEKAQFEPPKPHERVAGRNYKFGRPNSYPLFWLQKAEISSKAGASEWSGDLDGKLQDLTDDPPAIGKPTVLTFHGDFPKKDMNNVFGEALIDHTTDAPLERLTLQVGAFKVKGQELVNSPEVQLGFNDAVGGSKLKLELQQENVTLETDTSFDKINYMTGAKSKLVKEMLDNILKSVPTVTVAAAAKGPWSNLDFSFDTNLGRELQRGFEREIQAKISEARAKIRALIDEKIGAEKAKLQAQFKQIEAKLKGELAGKQGEVDSSKKQLEEAKAKALKDQGKKLEAEGKKHLDKLIKGKKLKF